MKRWLADRRVLGGLLVLSVAINLFLAGIVAGRFAGDGAEPARQVIASILEPLPADKRELVRRELRAAAPGVRRDFRAMQAARARLAEELLKTEPDAAQLDRHFAEVQARTTAIQGAMQQAFKRAAVSLSVEDRRAIVEALKQRRAKRLPEF